jgi:uncharacterized membrane protein YraQ (UPF0718 family)
VISVIFGLIKEIWHTFDDASFYILMGVVFAGLIQIFIDKDKIAKHLGKPGLKSVLLAALFGVPLPLCSCGVIPTAVSLRKNGASKGSVLSFLISTPESGVDSIALSYALLDPLMTVFRPVAAFFTAIVAGISENLFGNKNDNIGIQQESKCDCCDVAVGEKHSHSLFQRFRYGIRYAFVDLLSDIAVWLFLGIVIGGIISYFVPQNIIENYIGSGIHSMLFMLAVGIPLYICASASTPIAAALIAKGMSPGVALVFLLAGPATNAAGILSVRKFLGKRSMIIYLLSIAICAVSLGLILDQIYLVAGINAKAIIGKAGDVLPHPVKLFSAILLIGLMINSFFQIKKEKH